MTEPITLGRWKAKILERTLKSILNSSTDGFPFFGPRNGCYCLPNPCARQYERICIQWCSMSSVPQIPKQDTFRRIQRIQTLTIVWMTVEAAVSLTAAWMARSPALLAFGGDSAIELLSAIVVLWRFRAHADQEQSEKRAARIAAVLLFILAAYVAVASARTLLGYSEPKTTYVGIAVLVAAAAIMPWLAKEKRKLSAITGSAALRADAAESALCAYLALVALIGLGINAIWHIWWADPIAALVIVPLILWEGWEAMRGKACGCC